MRLVEFRRLLNDDNALRAQSEVEHGQVLKFTVQLECRFLEGDDFTPVIRYDTSHGFAHCDRLHPYEKATKITLYTQDYNEALTIAMDDLASNWSAYRRRFEEWLSQKTIPVRR